MLLKLIMAYKISIVGKKLGVALIYITRFFVVAAKKLRASSLCHSLVPHINVELLLRYGLAGGVSRKVKETFH